MENFSDYSPEVRPLLLRLTALIADLWFPSEGESTWSLRVWAEGAPDLAVLCADLQQPADAEISPLTPEEFLEQVERRCRGYGAEGREIAQRHRTLMAYCTNQLQTLQVLRIGQEPVVAIAILGTTTEGSAIALYTQSIET